MKAYKGKPITPAQLEGCEMSCPVCEHANAVLWSSFEDRTLVCRDCRAEFVKPTDKSRVIFRSVDEYARR